MAVAFDNTASNRDFSVTTVTTGAVTISGTNRAAAIGICTQTAGTSAFSASLGGTSGSLVTGAEATTNTHVLIFGVTAPPTGSQTATASWTTASNAVVGFISATGVDQTTPFNNGAATNLGFVASGGLSVTSTNGDLSVTVLSLQFGSAAEPTTDKTKKYSNLVGAGDIGTGTGTETHTWSFASDNAQIAGVNFKAAGGGTTTLRVLATMGVGK